MMLWGNVSSLAVVLEDEEALVEVVEAGRAAPMRGVDDDG